VNILMVTPRFLPFMGGVELHVAEVARRVAASGHQVTVLSTDVSGELPPEETWNGVDLRRVRAYPRSRDYYFAPEVYRHVARGGWDVVHVQSYHTFVAPTAMTAAWSNGIPYVVTFHAGGHSSSLRNALRGAQLAMLRPLLARAYCLVALAEFEIDAYSARLKLPRERFVLIPNGADLPAPAALPPRHGDVAPRIASIGRLERYKGHHHVLAALPAILEQHPGARLWIAGSGPYQSRLEALADQLGVAESTEIYAVPPADRARMATELAQVDVAVLVSDAETHPIAMLEAAAAGCRVVVADSPGLAELGRRGLATVVAHPEDSGALASALLEELDAPRGACSVSLPSWDECAAALCELYSSAAVRVASRSRRSAGRRGQRAVEERR
jgi:glycosyltransferase involved in cell wall biosynthesis